MCHQLTGHTGLSIIGSVVSKLLDPKAPECSAAYVGKLVSLLISKLSDSIGSDLDLILRAVLSKLQMTDTPTIVQVGTLSGPRSILRDIVLVSSIGDCNRRWRCLFL